MPTEADPRAPTNSVPESPIAYVDDAILRGLPKGTEIIRIAPSGTSQWARTAKIETINARGKNSSYFIKVRQGSSGKNGSRAEFQSMAALNKIMPDLVVRPIAWGAYDSLEDTWFFVMDFHQLSNDIPDPEPFVRLVSELHKNGTAPDGKFGTPWAVYGADGRRQLYKPTDTWEECFTFMLRRTLRYEIATQGPDTEIETMYATILDKVAPRLLRPLEAEGRTVEPRLCHGDLWDGNVSVDINTGNPIIFDAIPLYAHHEFELCTMRVPYHRMQQAYIDEYVKHARMSEPIEDFDDRLWLYYLYFNSRSSSCYSGNLQYRIQSKHCMRRLIEKHGDGYEGYLARREG
ncbi:Fructosamine kinase-domain-containing protein [Microdochium bolleyi]|uniref:protein-ribulosamine 3-kinase n=1 Tax=Microdochium bolleyi TaxID=196109 RepID=A0A136IPM2_9PEZI|nr:Fructosamine kinase-domain-containing protein [Microdochium bolleyi]